jgi:hypothetical protein
VTVPVEPGEQQMALARRLPYVAAMDATAAYVCRDFACEAPVTDPVSLAASL